MWIASAPLAAVEGTAVVLGRVGEHAAPAATTTTPRRRTNGLTIIMNLG